MTKKVRIITPESGLDLDMLDVKPGEYLGFYNTQEGEHHPFLFAFIGKKGLHKCVGDRSSKYWGELVLQHCSKEGSKSEYCLDTPDGVSQFFRSHKYGDLRTYESEKLILGSLRAAYCVEYAYVGIEEIIKALRKEENLGGFDVHANWLESEFDRIKTGR